MKGVIKRFQTSSRLIWTGPPGFQALESSEPLYGNAGEALDHCQESSDAGQD